MLALLRYDIHSQITLMFTYIHIHNTNDSFLAQQKMIDLGMNCLQWRLDYYIPLVERKDVSCILTIF